jgi:hypothetical protein
MNSFEEIVVVDNTGIPTGPNVGSGVENPLFESESLRTPAHTVQTSNPSSVPLIVCDLYGNLGVIPDRPMASQVPETYVTYTVPLYHFIGTNSNITTILDQLLIGSHLIPTLQMAHSTMVPQATTIPIGNVVISQALFGTPLPPTSNPSLPPGYRALNTFVSISSQVPSGGSGICVPLGHNVSANFIPTLAQVLSGGYYVPPPPFPGGFGPSGSNLL